mmetsp:Transcript_4009/g.25197  ORF Transcript_4009/g.25197 Transcript_4009/m.25197 type:complete len:407 (+) Transcript_4009:2014-3234(+)
MVVGLALLDIVLCNVREHPGHPFSSGVPHDGFPGLLRIVTHPFRHVMTVECHTWQQQLEKLDLSVSHVHEERTCGRTGSKAHLGPIVSQSTGQERCKCIAEGVHVIWPGSVAQSCHDAMRSFAHEPVLVKHGFGQQRQGLFVGQGPVPFRFFFRLCVASTSASHGLSFRHLLQRLQRRFQAPPTFGAGTKRSCSWFGCGIGTSKHAHQPFVVVFVALFALHVRFGAGRKGSFLRLFLPFEVVANAAHDGASEIAHRFGTSTCGHDPCRFDHRFSHARFRIFQVFQEHVHHLLRLLLGHVVVVFRHRHGRRNVQRRRTCRPFRAASCSFQKRTHGRIGTCHAFSSLQRAPQLLQRRVAIDLTRSAQARRPRRRHRCKGWWRVVDGSVSPKEGNTRWNPCHGSRYKHM